MNDGLLDLLCCPHCGGRLAAGKGGLRCGECGRVYEVRDGIPILVDLKAADRHLLRQIRYFEGEAGRRSAYELQSWQRRYLERLKETLPPGPGELVVDCGAGSGFMSIELARMGCRSLACDLTLRNLVQLRKSAGEQGLLAQIHLVCCDVQSLPFKDGVADVFIANHILEHLQRDDQAVAEIDRVCADGARLMVTTPLNYRLINPLFIPLHYVHDKRIGHLRRYDSDSLAAKFDGWKPVRTYYTGHFMKTVKTIANMAGARFSEDLIEASDRRKETHRYGASNVICLFERRFSVSPTGVTR